MAEQIADRYNQSKQLKVNEDGSIDTNLVGGDIEIGAVEIKDGETDTRQKVKTDGTDNAAVVTQNSQPLPTGAATSANQETIIAASNTVTEGGIIKQLVQDNNQEQLLTDILKQLKIMNIHLSILTDNTINKTEVE